MTFKKLMLAAMTVGFGLTPIAASAGADDYGIINNTGSQITHLYVSAHEQDSWGSDILGRDVLENGQECQIVFDKSDNRCEWDLKITDETGKDWVVMDVDLCKYTKITFGKDGEQVNWSGT